MAKFNWAVFCRQMITDEASRLTTLIDVIESVNFNGNLTEIDELWGMLPLGIVSVASFSRSDPNVPELTKLTVSILGPDGKVHTQGSPENAHIDLEQHNRSKVLLEFEGFPYRMDGTHYLQMEFSDGSGQLNRASLPIDISRSPPAQDLETSIESKKKPRKSKSKKSANQKDC